VYAAVKSLCCGTPFVFVIAVLFMALKPLLLHLTDGRNSIGSGTGSITMSPAHFQQVSEALKIAICVCALLARRAGGADASVWRGARHTSAFVAPAAVYLLMNCTVTRCARMLPPPTFQLLANSKVLFTATASWALLGRHVMPMQWLAMALLTAGLSIGQFNAGDEHAAPLLGVSLMLFNSCLSAIGGVLTEKLLKSAVNGDLSIFATNLHMAVHTLILNVLVNGLPDLVIPSTVVCLALCNEAVNGIIISFLMRTADSIVKNYAFSFSTFIIAGLSALTLSYWPRPQFFFGAAISLVSIALYTRSAAKTVKALASSAEYKKHS